MAVTDRENTQLQCVTLRLNIMLIEKRNHFPAWRSVFSGGCGEQAGMFSCCVIGQDT